MSTKLTLDQQRAERAWQEVRSVGASKLKDYASLAKAAPALVMSNGIMQTLAFLRSKASPDSSHDELLRHLCGWLGKTLGGTLVAGDKRFPGEQQADFVRVMEALHAAPSSLYLRATSESLALLRWIRQFADAHKAMKDGK
jgi:CRISPR-associated protein Cmr5